MAADTDAAGSTTALVAGYGSGRAPLRPRRAAPVTGDAPARQSRGLAGPVVDAAGSGALGIAWRVDKPRGYSAIAVALRDPGGTLSEPIAIAGADAGGVRHPALAIDPAGDALLAYNRPPTSPSQHARCDHDHLPQQRRRVLSPTLVDATPSSPPVIAIARDGTGVVAWTHDRRCTWSR